MKEKLHETTIEIRDINSRSVICLKRNCMLNGQFWFDSQEIVWHQITREIRKDFETYRIGHLLFIRYKHEHSEYCAMPPFGLALLNCCAALATTFDAAVTYMYLRGVIHRQNISCKIGYFVGRYQGRREVMAAVWFWMHFQYVGVVKLAIDDNLICILDLMRQIFVMLFLTILYAAGFVCV